MSIVLRFNQNMFFYFMCFLEFFGRYYVVLYLFFLVLSSFLQQLIFSFRDSLVFWRIWSFWMIFFRLFFRLVIFLVFLLFLWLCFFCMLDILFFRVMIWLCSLVFYMSNIKYFFDIFFILYIKYVYIIKYMEKKCFFWNILRIFNFFYFSFEFGKMWFNIFYFVFEFFGFFFGLLSFYIVFVDIGLQFFKLIVKVKMC